MFEPRGPEPRAVYLRRRATVAGAAVVALVAVVWLASSLAGGGADPQPVQAASAGSMTAGAPSASVAPASSVSPVSGPSGSEAAQSAAPAAPSSTGPSTTAPSTTAPPNTTPGNAPRNVACSDQAIGVSAQVADPTYPVGGQPVFRLLIKNTGKTLCANDLGANLQQVIVYSEDGKQRVWSSNDCFPGATPDLRTLKPDEEAVYSVQWSGNTSTEGCKTPRVPAGAGRYMAMTVLGSLQSRPVPFTIR
ncbi:MAG: hypothetical protein ACXVX9_14525 [Mycobacteriaceae bacterium]